MVQERKQGSTVDFHLEIKIKHRPGHYKVMEFSTCGVLLYTDKTSQFKPGDDIKLMMKLPELGETLEITAQVAQVTRKANGVKFTAEWSQDPKILEYCFNVFKNALPSPGA